MHYMLMICSDGVATEEKSAAMARQMPAWVEEMDARGVRVYGHPLAPVSKTKTVAVRAGETIIIDGPFAETKEMIAGFDIVDCVDLDEAIEVASKHPVAAFHSVEIRALMGPPGRPGIEIPDPALLERPGEGRTRYALFVLVNGIPEPEDEEQQIMRDGDAWWEHAGKLGVCVMGAGLSHADMATTVRVRGTQTTVTDGPFAETKEFLGGFCVLDLTSPDQAVELAASHPIARYHHIEVREFDQSGPER